jgi:hypothetical protein
MTLTNNSGASDAVLCVVVLGFVTRSASSPAVE